MPGGAFPEFPTNNLEKPAMPFRMSRTLRFSVEVECDQQDLRKADDKEIAASYSRSNSVATQCGPLIVGARSFGKRPQKCWRNWLMPKLRPMPKTEWENEKQPASRRFSLAGDKPRQNPKRR